MMYGYGMMGGMGWLGMLGMLLLWAGVIALVVWGLLRLFPRTRDAGPDAQGILRRRYASGEISREEYLQAVETLR